VTLSIGHAMNEQLNEYAIEYVNAYGFPCFMTVFSHNEDEALADFARIYPSMVISGIQLMRVNYSQRSNHA
jgi:hypothetical protein